MRKLTVMWILLAAWLAVPAAHSENLEIYRLSTAGADGWIWGDARITEKLGKFNVSENNKKGDTGGVFTADRLPYFENGVIELHADQVLAGTYTLQVLGFKGDANVSTLEPIAASTETGRNAFTLKGREMAEGVESLTFKIWVGGAEGAGIKFRDLVYSVPLADGQVVYDERFTDPGTWQADGILLAKAPAGMKLNVKPGTTFGNILGAQRIDRAMADAIYFETSDVKDCDLTLQLVTFDPDGNYVSSVDLIRKVTNGAHAARLAQAAWPPGAESFGIKIWMGDGATAAAVLKRLLVLGP